MLYRFLLIFPLGFTGVFPTYKQLIELKTGFNQGRVLRTRSTNHKAVLSSMDPSSRGLVTRISISRPYNRTTHVITYIATTNASIRECCLRTDVSGFLVTVHYICI